MVNNFQELLCPMNICVVGTGYVGLVVGTCLADFGNHVICVDNDRQKINNLKNGILPIYEIGLTDLVRRNTQAGRLEFSTDFQGSLNQSLVLFIVVGTASSQDGSADLSAVLSVTADIGKAITEYKVIVTKSTVPAVTGVRFAETIQQNASHSIDFMVASNPEFLREGTAIHDFLNPDRVVIGTNDRRAQAILRDIYRPLSLDDAPILMTTRETAEMIKYAANAFLATKISFINEMAHLCELVGADVGDVATGIGAGFLHPGPAYSGSCLPKYTLALLATAEAAGIPYAL